MKFSKALFCLSLLVFLGLAQLATQAQWQSQSQQQQSIRARISGGGGSGKCTFEVTIDGAADVEIQGDQGQLRRVGGGSLSWRRLDCNQPLPRNPNNFQFHGVDGRGTQTLVRDPASNNGIAVIRLNDPQSGSESYTGDITWNGGNDVGEWNNRGDRDDRGNWNRGNKYYSSGLRIIQAQYGASDRYSDVTSRLNSQIQNGQLNLQVNNNNMGGDPVRSQDKTLRVQYTYNGQRRQIVVNEGDYLRLPGIDQGDGNRYGNTATYQSDLRIIQAQYGVGNRFSDVTSRLNSQIQNGQLNLQVNNNNMGGDPARSQDKTLRVQYAYDGQRRQIVVNEGDYLRLPGQP